jgi:putative redox protein
MTTQARVALSDNLTTTIKIRQFTLTADEPIADGGLDLGPKPTELMLAALGSCAAITAKLYAGRKGWDLRGVEIDLSTERLAKDEVVEYTGDAPYVRRFTQNIVFLGDLTDEQKDRLLDIATRCPVHRAFTEPQVFIEKWVDAVIAEENT